MKWAVLFFISFSSTAVAQVNTDSDLLKKLKASEQLRNGTRANQLAQANVPLANVNWNNNFGANVLDSNIERRVVPLPQDNMPCVVPNMMLFRVMPNAGDSSMLKYPTDPGIYIRKNKKAVITK